jgi:hypothetical protein
LKIVAKGKVAAIILMDSSNQVFAICQVTDDAAVEKTLDSGRYFVLRITNAQGRHAYIGIAFNERNDSFDFNVALNEFKNENEREELANKLADTPVGPMKDLSLKEGEKIKIKIVSGFKLLLIANSLVMRPNSCCFVVFDVVLFKRTSKRKLWKKMMADLGLPLPAVLAVPVRRKACCLLQRKQVSLPHLQTNPLLLRHQHPLLKALLQVLVLIILTLLVPGMLPFFLLGSVALFLPL